MRQRACEVNIWQEKVETNTINHDNILHPLLFVYLSIINTFVSECLIGSYTPGSVRVMPFSKLQAIDRPHLQLQMIRVRLTGGSRVCTILYLPSLKLTARPWKSVVFFSFQGGYGVLNLGYLGFVIYAIFHDNSITIWWNLTNHRSVTIWQTHAKPAYIFGSYLCIYNVQYFSIPH